MSARDDLIDEYGRADTAPLGTLSDLKQKLDAVRVEVFNEAIAALQGLHDLNPGGRRAPQLAFSVGALMGARDFPGEVPSNGGIAVNPFTDRVYRDAYATGRDHAGADGWVLDGFEPVFSTSDGSHVPAAELRCRKCTGLVQDVGPKSLLDLMAMAAQHACPSPAATRKDHE